MRGWLRSRLPRARWHTAPTVESPTNPRPVCVSGHRFPGNRPISARELHQSGRDAVRFTDALGTNLPGGLYTNTSLTLIPPAGRARPNRALHARRLRACGLATGSLHQPAFHPSGERQDWCGGACPLSAAGLAAGQGRDATPIFCASRWLTQQPRVLCLTGDAGLTFYRPDGLLAIVRRHLPYQRQHHLAGQRTAILQLGRRRWLAVRPRGPCLEYLFSRPASIPPTRNRSGPISASASPPAPTPGLASNSPTPKAPRPGPTTRSTQKPSFNLYFNGDFGPGKLDYNLFTNYTTREFEHLRLRAGKNDISNPFITDEYVRRLFLDMGQSGSPAGLFCSLYINGIYRGIFNLCERFREQFFQAHFRSELALGRQLHQYLGQRGHVVYNQMLAALDRDLTIATNWQAADQLLDLENTADYSCSTSTRDVGLAAEQLRHGPRAVFRPARPFPVSGCGMPRAASPPSASASRNTAYNTLTNDLHRPSRAHQLQRHSPAHFPPARHQPGVQALLRRPHQPPPVQWRRAR